MKTAQDRSAAAARREGSGARVRVQRTAFEVEALARLRGVLGARGGLVDVFVVRAPLTVITRAVGARRLHSVPADARQVGRYRMPLHGEDFLEDLAAALQSGGAR